MKASLSDDRKSFTLKGRLWEGTFPVTKLEGQIKFYSDLAAKHANTEHEADLASTVRSLKLLRKRLEE